MFQNHVINQIAIGPNPKDVILFDPSYGTITKGANAEARLLAYQNASLDFVGGYKPSATDATLNVLTLTPITATSKLLISNVPNNNKGK